MGEALKQVLGGRDDVQCRGCNVRLCLCVRNSQKAVAWKWLIVGPHEDFSFNCERLVAFEGYCVKK